MRRDRLAIFLLCFCLLTACATSPADLQRQGLIPTNITFQDAPAATSAPEPTTPIINQPTATRQPTLAALPSPLPAVTLQPTRQPTLQPSPTRPQPTHLSLPTPTGMPTEAPPTPTPAPVLGFAALPVSACPQGCLESQPGCEIKGNINSDGVKIFHTLSSPWYARTKISPEKGERWFCTETEAIDNGWRAPRGN